MGTENLTGVTVTTGVPDTKAIPLGAPTRVYCVEKTIDLTAYASGDATHPLTTADIKQVIPIPANTLVRAAVLRIDTAAVGTVCTIDVGPAGGATLATGLNGKTAQTNAPVLIGVVEASVQSVWYGTADTIDVTFTTITAITAGPKFTLFIECVDCN